MYMCAVLPRAAVSCRFVGRVRVPLFYFVFLRPSSIRKKKMERDRLDSGSSRRSRSSNGERDYHHADGAKRLRIDAPSETDNRDRRYAAEVEQQWPSHKIVKLNVGGQKYTTTVATLRRARVELQVQFIVTLQI